MYQERFPNDTVIVTDAHKYLLEHYKEFDFIWSSPPCPTHSKMKKSQVNNGNHSAAFPDMKLYEEIIFLDNFFNGKYCVENVIPYYEPLIEAQKRGRHLYWCNFKLPGDLNDRRAKNFIYAKQSELEKFHEINLITYKGEQRKDKIARNLVDYEAGRTILETALEIKPKRVIQSLFDDEIKEL